MKSLVRKIINLIKKKKIKISVAESCTGGILSSAITSVSGSSKVFNLGLVYCLVVPPDVVDDVQSMIGLQSWVIGDIISTEHR